MTLKDINDRLSVLSIHEQRQQEDHYSELVFCRKDLESWTKVFLEIFGPAVKAEGASPTREDRKLTEGYGGIRNNQVLFKKNCDGITVIAMLWPWESSGYITLKLALLTDNGEG